MGGKETYETEAKISYCDRCGIRYGSTIAELFAKEGAKVILADYNLEGAEAVAARIRENGGTAKAIESGCSGIDRCGKYGGNRCKRILGHWTFWLTMRGSWTGLSRWRTLRMKNGSGFSLSIRPVSCARMRKAIPIFLEKGSGVIINIASTGGFSGAHAGAAYVASKHAVIGLTKNTGFMYANKGIRCNAIAPGAVATNIGASIQNVNPFGMERAGMTHKLSPRSGQSEEIAQVALFLASDASSFINGAVITADGGWTAAF